MFEIQKDMAEPVAKRTSKNTPLIQAIAKLDVEEGFTFEDTRKRQAVYALIGKKYQGPHKKFRLWSESEGSYSVKRKA